MKESDIKHYSDPNDVKVYVDPETGVNYMIYIAGYAGGITVRLNADGTPYVSE